MTRAFRLLLLACALAGFIGGASYGHHHRMTWLELVADAAAYAEARR